MLLRLTFGINTLVIAGCLMGIGDGTDNTTQSLLLRQVIAVAM